MQKCNECKHWSRCTVDMCGYEWCGKCGLNSEDPPYTDLEMERFKQAQRATEPQDMCNYYERKPKVISIDKVEELKRKKLTDYIIKNTKSF